MSTFSDAYLQRQCQATVPAVDVALHQTPEHILDHLRGELTNARQELAATREQMAKQATEDYEALRQAVVEIARLNEALVEAKSTASMWSRYAYLLETHPNMRWTAEP